MLPALQKFLRTLVPAPPTAPNLVSAAQLAATWPALQVQAAQLAEGVRAGTHGRRRSGMGEQFWQFRPYQSHDLPNRIDWKKSARSDNLYLREQEQQIAQTVQLWVAQHAGFDWHSNNNLPHKSSRAALLALALALLLQAGGERVGYMGAPAVPTAQFTTQLLKILSAKNAVTAEQDWPHLTAPMRSTVVLFTDGLMPAASIAPFFAQCVSRNYKGVLVQIIDPAEIDFPYRGRVEFWSPELLEHTVLNNAAAERAAYQHAFAKQQALLQTAANAAGFGFIQHRTDQPASTALLWLQQRLQA